MPADERFWRNLKTMHVVFALSAAALLVSMVLMMWQDHNDEWRVYQRTWDEIEAAKLAAQTDALETAEHTARVESLEEQLAAAEAAIDQSALSALRSEIATSNLQVTLASQDVREQRAVRDKARADYDLAVAQGRSASTLDELFRNFQQEQRQVDRLEANLQQLELALDAQREQLQTLTKTRDELQAELDAAQAEIVRLETARRQIDPEGWFSSAKRTVMQWPVIDGFNSPHKIQMDWLPDHKITLGMAKTARFDHCRTCHLGIDRVETGNIPAFPHGHPETDDVAQWVADNEFPHPFATHPHPELYLTPSSPHPLSTFGCTICHEGQGSGTSFANAAHSPNNPHIEHEWEHEYDFAYNHFWEYPMLPERFEESTCLKCHHSVTELGVNPKWGATAPQVHEGFTTIESYGCFGCHEIHGFDGDRRIGPDLRLEPNYWAVALQLLNDPAVPDDPHAEGADDAGTMLVEISRLAREVSERPAETDEQRRELRQLILADKGLEQPRLSVESHNLADELKDVDHPGTYRKVGPSLRHIASKTFREWIEYWTEDPQRFRPTTNMPRFFHLSNQEDPHAAALQPVELAGISEYLLAKSQPLDLLAPEDGYEPDAERGRLLFSQRGCLACHSHGEFPEIDSDFGPKLDRVHEKILPGDEGFHWLYTWIRDPHRHSPRSRMPNLFVEPYELGGEPIDPAADIAAFLLKRGEEEPMKQEFPEIELSVYIGVAVADRFTDEEARDLGLDEARGARVTQILPHGPATRATLVTDGEEGPRGEARLRVDDVILQVGGTRIAGAAAFNNAVEGLSVGEEVLLTVWRDGAEQRFRLIADEPLNDLVRLYLSKVLKNPQVEETFTTRNFPLDPSLIKGDEIELSRAAAGLEDVSEEEWRSMKLRYIGRRTISRYGCYGCHDVPGFEAARPIGTPLQDWGRKDSSKLAFEHIEEYLHHHGEPTGESTHERVVSAMESAEAEEYDNRIARLEESLAANRKALAEIDEALETAEDKETLQKRRQDLLPKISADEAMLVTVRENRETELSAAYFYDSLLHHGRPGFIWQKLREPRSYDYLKTDTKGYDERLRMPKFPVSEHEIEAIATFVLGLVAEPPATQYVYQPDDRERTRIAGAHLLEKYNCASCHMLTLPQVEFGLPLELPSTSELADGGSFESEFEDLVTWLAENPEAAASAEADARKWAEQPPEDLQPQQKDLVLLRQLGFDLGQLGKISRAGVPMEQRQRELNEWLSVRAFVGMTADDIAAWLVEHAAELRDGVDDVATYPPGIQRMIRLGANLDEIAQLISNKENDPILMRASAEQWLTEHPEMLLVSDLQADESLAGVRQLVALKPPFDGDTDEFHDGAPVVRFQGLLRAAPDPEEPDPEFRIYSYSLFNTLSIGGRVIVPGSTMSFIEPQLAQEPDETRAELADKGPFAQFLVGQIAADDTHKAFGNRSKAWEAVPPPLYLEGHKVQTAWLYRFLKNPDRIRHETVLRMPRFNMTDAEARTLANYFAAADGTQYPYDEIPQREEGYLASVEQALESLDKQPEDAEYLDEAWQVLVRNDLCVGCHSVGGRPFQAGADPKQVTHGPDLQRVPDRLRPEYLQLWLYKPAWVLPYTSMPAPGSKPMPGLFGADPQVQAVALRDALLNYHRMMERDLQEYRPPMPIAPAGQPAGEGQPTPEGGTAPETSSNTQPNAPAAPDANEGGSREDNP